MNGRRGLFFTLAVVLLAAAAGSLLFSTYMMYDDEGYVLFSLREFVEGGGLYDRIFSHYGPFFFLFHQLLHLGGLEFTNTAGRLLALGYWLGASVFGGALIWRLTRSTSATVFAAGGIFLYLWPLISEPSHPGGLIVLAVAGLGWLGARWSDRPRRLAAAAGAVGAALLLTKINVGIFLCAGAGAWWLLHLDERFPGPRARTALATAALALLPLVLMGGEMDIPWVRTFAFVAAAAAAAMSLAAAQGVEPRTRWRDLGPAALAAALVMAISLGGVLAQGTSPAGLLEGILLGPLRHPQAYSVLVKWRFGALPVALLGLILAGAMRVRPWPCAARIVITGRLVAVAAFFPGLLFDWPLGPHPFALSYGLATAWLFVMPVDEDRTTQPARAWLGLLVVTQALHAFPVAGSQISWGTFLWIPLAAIGVHDAVRVLRAGRLAAWDRVRRLAAAVVALAVCVRCAQYGWIGVTRFRDSDALGLPGAAELRLPENFSTTLRVLARNAAAHADVLFSLPGLHSFHLWTGLPPPTTFNATHWFTLLTPARQEEIRRRLEASPRSCVIVQRSIYDFLKNLGVATETPLTTWLQANYERAFGLETYEFWVRRGRRIAALNAATVAEAIAGVVPRFQISLTLAEPELRQVAAIDLAQLEGDASEVVHTWTGADAEVFLTPVNSAGEAAGMSRPVTFPFDVAGLVRLELRTDAFPAGFPTGHGVIHLRDAEGNRVAEARFVERAPEPGEG